MVISEANEEEATGGKHRKQNDRDIKHLRLIRGPIAAEFVPFSLIGVFDRLCHTHLFYGSLMLLNTV